MFLIYFFKSQTSCSKASTLFLNVSFCDANSFGVETTFGNSVFGFTS